MRCASWALVPFTCVLLIATPVLADDAPASSGDRLDPSTYGVGVVESVADMMARDRTRTGPTAPGGRNGAHGRWIVPSEGATYFAHSGVHYLTNEWGDTRMAIGFPRTVDLHGAFIAGQAGAGAWTRALRAVGLLGDRVVRTTDWFEPIGAVPAWFEMDLRGIDRVVFEAVPVIDGGGWYALDDLTYTVLPMTGTAEQARRVVLDFEDTQYRQALSGSNYAGLRWESGTGDFEAAAGVPAPQVMPTQEEPPGARTGGGVARDNLGTPPDLEMSFQGPIRGDSGTFSYPPDTCGAVGPDHFVSVVNLNVSMYNKANGARVANVTLGSFFSPFSTGGDPRIVYDQYSDRWIAIASSFSSGRSIQLAVSTSSDPTGTWFKNQFLAAAGTDASCWPDYPTLGVSEQGVFVTSFMVSCGMSVFAIDKAPLIAATPSLGTITAFRGLPFEGAIQPVHTFGTVNGEYLISRASSTTLRVRQITGALSGPTLFDRGSVVVPNNDAAADAPALGSTSPLDTVDTRLMNAVYRDGAIWTAHTVNIDQRAACRWYQVDPQSFPPTVIQVGTVSDATLHYFFPSIMVNARGDAVMGFTGSSENQFAGAYFTGRSVSDPPDEMAPPQLYQAGMAAQNNFDNYGRNRWGDYSLTSLDPNNERQMWTIQEYGHATNIWGTYIARLNYGDCNNNNVLDDDDISGGTSADCNASGIPDECELSGGDCNSNAVPDACDITAGTESDCNGNAVPDSCDVANGDDNDCNSNGVPDLCDVASAGGSDDCNLDAVPDECQMPGNDCNGNSRLDVCDSADHASTMVGPSDQNPCPDEAVSFTVSAAGATGYQWLRNDAEALVEGGPYTNVNGATLTIDPAGAGGDPSTYTCRVSFGCVQADSRAATLDPLSTQLDVALVSTSPVAGCGGGGTDAVFIVEVDDPLGALYRWSKDGVDLADDARTSGAQTAKLEITNAIGTDSGAYRCRVWNNCIDPADAVSTIGVLAFVDPVFTRQPASRCAEPGENAEFHAEATGTAPFFTRWYEGNTALSDTAKFSGTTSDVLTVHSVQLADNGRQFRLRAIVPDPFCTTYSVPATLIALPAGTCPACQNAPGDMDGDGDFDLGDLQAFTACFGADASVQDGCACANLAVDDALVNQADWTALQLILTGPQ